MNNEIEELEEFKETVKAIRSGTSAVHLCGDDYSRIDDFVTQLAFALGFKEPDEKQVEKAAVVEWNYGYGQVNFLTRAKTGIPPNDEKLPFPKFLETYKQPKYARGHIILIRNARHILDGEMNRENLAQLQQTIVHLKKKLPGQAVLIYCDEKRFLPDELASLVYFLDVKPPSQKELEKITYKFIERKGLDVTNHNLIEQLSLQCVGMSEDSFTQILNKAVLDNEKNFTDAVLPLAQKTKKQFVDKSGLLKYVNVEVDIDNDVGGLGHLKWWLAQNKKAFENPKGAKEKGINPAKGILLVGMPGCGKSLTSKAVAAFFGFPLLSLDLGSLMGKYLGESEENLRRALRLAENSNPCVLWVDEIEKAFAGVGGDESGVSQRLFGYLLTWLNDKTARVFVMATANDVAVLPPEFLRRGRFDEIFYVDFPSEYERKEIFKIHIGKIFGKNIVKGMEEEELQAILEKEKISREKLEEKLGKEEFDKIIKNNEKIKKDFDELTRDKKSEDKKNNEGKIEKVVTEDEKTYPGTEGYAGSDIEALVNAAVKRSWNNEGNNEEKIETSIFRILLSERKYMTPLKEVLAEKIKKNKKKFGEYKLTSASETADNLQRFETDS
jgi:SpoVK/Ycf46/Vps4 family AAA+-type ATPase